MNTRLLTRTALFAALTAAGAFIRIPLGYSSITLQFLCTAMAGCLLGPAYGAASQAVYVVLGLMGLPIFTQGGGLSYLLACRAVRRGAALHGGDPEPLYGQGHGLHRHPLGRYAAVPARGHGEDCRHSRAGAAAPEAPVSRIISSPANAAACAAFSSSMNTVP